MINLNDELVDEYLAESREHLATIETGLLALEKGSGAEFDEELANRLFRAMHSVTGGAGVFDLVRIRELAHQAENVLELIRSRKLEPTPERVRSLLRAKDKLNELVRNPAVSNGADISGVIACLAKVCADDPTVTDGRRRDGGRLRMLLVEDDFTSRLVLQIFLARYGECHVAVNGREAVEAVRCALERGERYDLICMDILMPEMNGGEAVRKVRSMEEAKGIFSTSGSKIIMTTALDDMKEVIRCFKELCDAYLVKPIDLAKLLDLMKSYQLVR